jgi:uncharacterized membrane protein (UPF0127 family)
MALKGIVYFVEGKKKKIRVEVCDTFLSKLTGLMFRKNSSPLLFAFNKNKLLRIHSFFCGPFKAIWLDEKMRSTQVVVVKTWKFNISGRGKHLLEIPIPLKNNKSSSEENTVNNRKI